MKIYEEAIPLVIRFRNDKTIFAITLPSNQHSNVAYYRGSDHKFYHVDFNDENIKSIRRVNDDVQSMYLYAKLIDIEDSSMVFGGKERKKEFLGSVLRVVDIRRDIEQEFEYTTLLTGRLDEVYIKMLKSELRFIYPKIYHNIQENKSYAEGDTIVAIKHDSAKTYRIGERFIITSITPSNHNSDFDIISAKSKKKSIVGYAKNFKHAKN